MTINRILKIVQDRGTISLMIHYPAHKQIIALAALADNRLGHGKGGRK